MSVRRSLSPWVLTSKNKNHRGASIFGDVVSAGCPPVPPAVGATGSPARACASGKRTAHGSTGGRGARGLADTAKRDKLTPCRFHSAATTLVILLSTFVSGRSFRFRQSFSLVQPLPNPVRFPLSVDFFFFFPAPISFFVRPVSASTSFSA